MVEEVIGFLKPEKAKVFVDCTLGGGGHLLALLSRNPGIKVYAFDQDRSALAAAEKKLSTFPGISYFNDNFSQLGDQVKEKVDGILFDLGVSSHQLDTEERGFSLRHDGPLDMRMDQRTKLTAADFINNYPAEALAKTFSDYGEERFAKRIARAIASSREKAPLKTTFELKAIIEKAIPTWKKRESVTRVFQALRIAVNHELASLENGLKQAIDLLAPGGRLAVIAYHSLEDRLVKQAFRQAEHDGRLKVLTKKPLSPGPDELAQNPRARSAKLRAAEKV